MDCPVKIDRVENLDLVWSPHHDRLSIFANDWFTVLLFGHQWTTFEHLAYLF